MTDIIEKARMYHFTTGLPVRIYTKVSDTPALSLPETIASAEDITGASEKRGGILNALELSAQMPMCAQYVSSPNGERFIYMDIEENGALLIGPAAGEEQNESGVSALIRRQGLPLRLKKELTKHFCGLAVIDDDRFYYCGKLLELIFAGQPREQDKKTLDVPDTAIDKSWFDNTYSNRLSQFRHPPYFLEQEICRLITLGDKKSFEAILHEINSRPRARLSKDALRSLKNSLIASCTFITRAAIQGGVSPDEAFTLSDSFIQQIELCQSAKALDSFERQMISVFIDRVNDKTKTRYSQIVRSAIEYIEGGLSEPITLGDIAQSVFVHPNYLSSLFKKETGEQLSHYIQRRRVEESKYYILYSTDSFADIAAFYQFCPQSHYVQVFRRYTGMTPGAYKARMSESGRL